MNKREMKIEMLRHSDTGYALAEFLGISPTSLSKKINGKSEFTRGEIMKIIERYELTPERIVAIFFTSCVSSEDTEDVDFDDL